jgi:hypothetical protein
LPAGSLLCLAQSCGEDRLPEQRLPRQEQ